MVTAARHFVTDWSRQRHLPEDSIDTLELLISEVVANAVLHGRGQVLISIVDGADPTTHPPLDPPAHPAGDRQLRGDGQPTRSGARAAEQRPGPADTDGDPEDAHPDLTSEPTATTAPPVDSGSGMPRRVAEQVVVAVSDAGPGQPQVKTLSQDSTGGRGLALVDMLAHTWGVTVPTEAGTWHPLPPLADAGLGGATGGKTTWFTVTT